MPSLEVAINSRRMPYSTLFSRWMKAPEHLYYFFLLSIHPSYAGDAEAWRSWIRMGFSLALRDGPPSAKAHRLVMNAHHTPRRIVMSIEGGDADTMAELEKLIRTIDTLRPSLAGKEDQACGEALFSNALIDNQLVRPAKHAWATCGLTAAETAALTGPLKLALAALASDYVTGIETNARLTVTS